MCCQWIELSANMATIIGVGVSVIIFCKSVERERKLLTMESYVKIREKYSSNLSDDDLKEYLKDMEFFCLGVNNKIYDFRTLQKMSGKRLLGQYRDKTKTFIQIRRKERKNETVWCEYEKVIKRLERHYSTKEKSIFIRKQR